MIVYRRRHLLAAAAYIIGGAVVARAETLFGAMPWHPEAGAPPRTVRPGPWLFFTAPEAAAVEALVDRLIPPDSQYAGGREAGCAVFIDRQLAGPYGRREGEYLSPPFIKDLVGQGSQSEMAPAGLYRAGLTALDKYCRANKSGKTYAELSDEDKDAVLLGLEEKRVNLEGADGKAFFEQLIKDTQTGFFADPIYGGNRNMIAWRMIGYPGVRYDYRDWVSRHNERYPLPPVSLQGRIEWNPA
jgi:gluconate 2-dehydrogenase gamma chain